MPQRHAVALALLGALGLTLVPTGAAAKGFSAPAGQLGAGLKTEGPERFRAYGDLAFFTTSPRPGTTAVFLSTDLGFGFRVLDELELQLDVPVAGIFEGANRIALGNIAVSANWFSAKKSFLWKLGAGVAAGPWLDEWNIAAINLGLARQVRSLESPWLWGAGMVTVFVPARLELGDELRFTLDAAFDIGFPTIEFNETFAYIGFAPGVSYRPTPAFCFGARLPGNIIKGTASWDQFAFEPFVRADIDKTFLAARFTMPLDEPLGFAFDSRGYWALQAAVGTTF